MTAENERRKEDGRFYAHVNAALRTCLWSDVKHLLTVFRNCHQCRSVKRFKDGQVTV